MTKLMCFLLLSTGIFFAQTPKMPLTNDITNGSQLHVSVANATNSSIDFYWTELKGDFKYSITYKVNTNQEFSIGDIKSRSYRVSQLNSGDTVFLTVFARESTSGTVTSATTSFTLGGNVCATSVVPPTILNGITITETAIGDVSTYPNAFTSCGNVITPANSKHLGSNGPFNYTMHFSQPVNNLVFAITATGHSFDEVFIVNTNTGIPAVTTTNSCHTTIAGNVITSGATAPPGTGGFSGGGGGIFIVTGVSNFTSLTISGPGGVAGSLLSVCSNSISPVECNVNVAPILSATSIGTICPATTVDLSVITASNTPAFPGIFFTWHSGTPATATNQLTAVQVSQLPAGITYYAAFFDNANSCYSATTAVATIINPSITPSFTQISPICSGENLTALPTTSINGVTGTWSPALNNAATTIYTFLPTVGQCAATVTMTIAVNPIVSPTFTPINTICSGTVIPSLPTTSNNGVTGSWSPAMNTSATTTYTFTPGAGQCAINAELEIAVDQVPVVTISQQCNEMNYTLTANSDVTENVSYQWYNGSNQVIATTQTITVVLEGDYRVVVTNNICDGQAIYGVDSVYCGIPKGISPNGDGSNDWFDLSGLNVSHLQIYNRYGILVYDKNNYLNEWGGKTDSGKELPDATYYYLIEFKNAKPKTGWVYVNREL